MNSLKKNFLITLFAVTAILHGGHNAFAVLIDFEGLTDLENVTNQYSAQGVNFTYATAGVAPPAGTLNEIDFPPTSGVTLVTNEVGPTADVLPNVVPGQMLISFTSPFFTYVSGFFVYSDLLATGLPLTISAFSSTDPLNPIGTQTLSENLGNPSQVSFSGIGAIAAILASGGQGSFFTLDNLVFENAATSPGTTNVPEPSTWFLVSAGLAFFSRRRFKI